MFWIDKTSMVLTLLPLLHSSKAGRNFHRISAQKTERSRTVLKKVK